MNLTRWLNIGALIGTLICTPTVLLGVQRCQPEAAAGTNSENFSRSASALLKDIPEDAQRVRYHAGVIEDFTNSQQADWEAHAHELRRIKAEVDDMGRRLGRLEMNEGATTPWEQQAIHQAAPLVQFLADNTDDAIYFLNAHQGDLWSPRYKQNAENLSAEASAIAQSIGHDEALRKTENSYLRRNLGMLVMYGK